MKYMAHDAHLTNWQSNYQYERKDAMKTEFSPNFRKTDLVGQSRTHSNESNDKFDSVTFKGNRQSFTLFPQFDLSQQEDAISLQIMKENTILKQQLFESRQIIDILKTELTDCRQHLLRVQATAEEDREQYLIKEKIKMDMRDEITIIMNKNKAVEQQLSSLTSSLQHRDKSIDKYRKISPYNCKTSGLIVYSQPQKSLTEQRRTQQLLNSIKQMYSKIMGYQVDSLKQLWRWLKNICHVSNCLKKWRSKAIDLLQSNPRHQRLRQLIGEALTFTD